MAVQVRVYVNGRVVEATLPGPLAVFQPAKQSKKGKKW